MHCIVLGENSKCIVLYWVRTANVLFFIGKECQIYCIVLGEDSKCIIKSLKLHLSLHGSQRALTFI